MIDSDNNIDDYLYFLIITLHVKYKTFKKNDLSNINIEFKHNIYIHILIRIMRKYSWDLIIDISNSVEYYTPENHSYISMLFIFL